MIGAPWIYSEELEPRVLALLGELAAARSIILDEETSVRSSPRAPALEDAQIRDEARVKVRELKRELRNLLSGVG